MRITELRKNPDVNRKINTLQQLKELQERYKDQTLFVSFTSLDKLGINPSSRYSTPIGIYAYPLDYVLRRADRQRADDTINFSNIVPFAGESRYVTVFSAKGTIVDLADTATLERWIEKFKTLSGKPVLPNAYKQSSTPQLFWSYTMYLSQKGTKDPDFVKPKEWNKLFRTVGIDGVVDSKGSGTIHPNEPTQAVFFSIESVNVITRILNNQQSHKQPAKFSFSKVMRHSTQLSQPEERERASKFVNTIIKQMQSLVSEAIDETTQIDNWFELKSFEIGRPVLEKLAELNTSIADYFGEKTFQRREFINAITRFSIDVWDVMSRFRVIKNGKQFKHQVMGEVIGKIIPKTKKELMGKALPNTITVYVSALTPTVTPITFWKAVTLLYRDTDDMETEHFVRGELQQAVKRIGKERFDELLNSHPPTDQSDNEVEAENTVRKFVKDLTQ